TMLCRMLEAELPDQCDIIYLANPSLSPDHILQAIAFELRLDLSATASKFEAMQALHDFLLAKHADNRRVVMFVEEAQRMPIETLEEIRLLSNLETSSDKLLQIVLFGQPELDETLGEHAIRQLRERITYSFKLAPLNRTEIRDYVNTRLRTSGYRGSELFAGRAIAELADHSEGLLRRINILADKALLAAFAENRRSVGRRHVRMAARDSEFLIGRRSPAPLLMASAAALVLALGAVVLLAGRGALDEAATAAETAKTAAAPELELDATRTVGEDIDRIATDSIAVLALGRPPVREVLADPHVAPAVLDALQAVPARSDAGDGGVSPDNDGP
ncbi:MAG: AAA family ATPase, partial [Gammaproteobacteria bacterium]|nr:AAA family ATPase [Gammaproteobacteria bacterium]